MWRLGKRCAYFAKLLSRSLPQNKKSEAEKTDVDSNEYIPEEALHVA